jgi:uncharacterized OB-fold protein
VSNTTTHESYLPAGLPIPVPEADGLSAPFWNGLREGRLRIQHCQACGTWQHAPEWLCHHCHAFDPPWDETAPRGRIYSWERVWHPVHPCLNGHGPYLVVVAELPGAGGVRMLGNLLGDPNAEVVIGAEVEGVFEHHPQAQPPFTLLQWRYVK